MTTPEIISTNARSESAKRRWEKERQKKQKEADPIMNTQKPIKAWVYHSEWFALMTTVIACFLFVHHETVHVTERLDNHIEAINRRCDDLHKEFYDLLKEMNKGRSNDQR